MKQTVYVVDKSALASSNILTIKEKKLIERWDDTCIIGDGYEVSCKADFVFDSIEDATQFAIYFLIQTKEFSKSIESYNKKDYIAINDKYPELILNYAEKVVGP